MNSKDQRAFSPNADNLRATYLAELQALPARERMRLWVTLLITPRFGLLFADHEPNKRERPSIVRPAKPSEAAKSKIARRQSVDETPIMAWRDLIANLGTLTINEV